MSTAEITSTALVEREKTTRFQPAIFFAALLVPWLFLWNEMRVEWSVNEQYGYGWFVPPFAAILFLLRWKNAPAATSPKTHATSIAFIVIAVLVILPLRLIEIPNPDWRTPQWLHAFLLVGLSLTLLWTIGGRSWARHFFFPVAFVLIAVPWPSEIENPLVQGLMRQIAGAVAETMNLLGIPAEQAGNLISVRGQTVGVNEACSGIRSLQTTLMAALLLGELRMLSNSRRFFLLLGGLGLALFANYLRSGTLVWIAGTQGVAALEHWHDAAGMAVLVTVIIGLYAFSAWLQPASGNESRASDNESHASDNESRASDNESRASDNESHASDNESPASDNESHASDNESPACAKESPACAKESPACAKESHASDNDSPVSNNHPFPIFHPTSIRLCLGLIAALVLGEIFCQNWYAPSARTSPTPWTFRSPVGSPGYKEIPIDNITRAYLRYDSAIAASWQTTAPLRAACTVFFLRWEAGRTSAIRATMHQPHICLTAMGMKQENDDGLTPWTFANGLQLPVREYIFTQQKRPVYVFYIVWRDGLVGSVPDPSLNRWDRFDAVRDRRRNPASQTLEIVVNGVPDQAAAQQVFRNEMNRLLVVPKT